MKTIAYPVTERRQRGTTAIEFAIVAMVFLLIVLGIAEFGRILYMWNTVQEVTRRAAREAVVRDFGDKGKVARMAVFGDENGSGTVLLPAGAEITNASIRINYLNASLAPITPPADAVTNFSICKNASLTASCVRYVEACVATNDECTDFVNYAPMVTLFPYLNIRIPVSRVVMPTESLGLSVP